MNEHKKWAIYAICLATVAIVFIVGTVWFGIQARRSCPRLLTERAQLECIRHDRP